ncbi:ArsR/SmtB family transcription factor [Achromobacter xylosoxidans]|jgi:DNA-binding transcriptional ArsR family regulator|uniref:ArsR/SmtB family transcription factor n=2 Tax=Pseudomonadota TaxID=1224 RepID=UPI003D242FCB
MASHTQHQHETAPGSAVVPMPGCKHDAADVQTPLELPHSEVAVVAQTFHLLGDPSRLRILLQCMRGATPVGDIAENLDLSQSLVSHHLRLLRGARLVRGERRVKQVFYEIADNHVARVLRDMAEHISEDQADD